MTEKLNVHNVHEIVRLQREMRHKEAEIIGLAYFQACEANVQCEPEDDFLPDELLHEYSQLLRRSCLLMANMPEGYFIYQVFDATGDLLYIGMTGNLGERMMTHFGRSLKYPQQNQWADQVAQILFFPMPSKLVAEATEKELIRRRNPRYNILHNKSNNQTAVSPNGRRRLPPRQPPAPLPAEAYDF
jgi:predicted GIY-YIG superfamily endonuclease